MTDYDKGLNRGVAGGVISCAGLFMAFQDWFGLEGYIAHLRENWIPLPWWVGLVVAMVAIGWTHKRQNG